MRCCIDPRRIAAALMAIFGLAAALAGCSKAPTPTQPAQVAFYWTCDARGRLEPCGCFTGQHGGLTRVSTFLNSPDTLPDPILADVGNAIAGAADYQVLQYRYMQKAFADMHYAALNIGEREAQLSAAELKKLRDASPVPMVSANLVDRASGQPIFAPYRMIERGGYHIALVGALGETPPENLGEGVAVEPMKSAIAKVLPEIKKQADVIVLLAFADEPAMRALADEFYELNVILGGKVKEPSQTFTRQNQSVVLWTTNETKALGMFRANVTGRGKLRDEDFNIVFVNEHIPQDEKLLQISHAYREEIRKTPLEVDNPSRVKEDEVPGVKPVARYVGTESCAPCHDSAYKVWQNTGHAQAFQSLAARQSDADPNCIGCHTVGFGTASGYQRAWDGKKLANVGCESCHGPGSEHVNDFQNKRVGSPPLFHYRPVGAADCTACHYGEFSRPFDYASFWQAIKHGKEPPQFRLH